jgi:hypothetical protein
VSSEFSAETLKCRPDFGEEWKNRSRALQGNGQNVKENVDLSTSESASNSATADILLSKN